MVNRLRPILPKLISNNQAAFVPSRSIQENSVLAQELFHSMKHKSGRKGVMAVKLDMKHMTDWSVALFLRCCGALIFQTAGSGGWSSVFHLCLIPCC